MTEKQIEVEEPAEIFQTVEQATDHKLMLLSDLFEMLEAPVFATNIDSGYIGEIVPNKINTICQKANTLTSTLQELLNSHAIHGLTGVGEEITTDIYNKLVGDLIKIAIDSLTVAYVVYRKDGTKREATFNLDDVLTAYLQNELYKITSEPRVNNNEIIAPEGWTPITFYKK